MYNNISFFRRQNSKTEVPVKTRFRNNENPCTCPPSFPACVCGKVPKGRVITRKPVVPTDEEINENSRSKSSKLRVFERV